MNVGGTLEIQGGLTFGVEPVTLNGSGSGGIGALRNLSGNNTWNSTLTLLGNASIESTAGLLTLDVPAGNVATGNFDLTIQGASDTVIADPIGVGTAGLIKQGAGTLSLLAPSIYSGLTTINDGVISLENAAALGDTTAGTIVNSGGALVLPVGLTVTGETLSISGTGVAGTGALRSISGTTTWTSTVTLLDNASIQVDAGKIVFDVASGDAFTGTTYDLTIQGSGDLDILDPIATGTGGLIKAGTGKTVLTATNTYTGTTTINDGTLTVDGTLISTSVNINTGGILSGSGSVNAVASAGGTISPGDTTAILNTSSITLDSTSKYQWEFQAPFTAAGAGFDQLNVNGTVTLNGTLVLIGLTGTMEPALGSKFVIINNDGSEPINGIFAGKTEGSLVDSAQGYRFTISYAGGGIAGNNNDVELTYFGRIPGVTDDNYTIAEDGILDDTIKTNDFIYFGVSYKLLTNVMHGKLTNFNTTDGSFTYIPNSNFIGTDSFTYNATDSFGTSSPTNATVTINIPNTPDQPIITSGNDTSGLLTGFGTVSVAENLTVITTVVADDGDLVVNDGPGDSIVYSIVPDVDSDGALFTINPATGELSFITGVPDFENPIDGTAGVDRDNIYTVYVRATDATLPIGLFDTQLLSISIINANDPPTFTSPVITGGVTNIDVSENTVSPQKFIAIDQDNVTGDLRFNISKVAGASNVDAGLFSIDPISGILTFKQAGGADYDSPIDDGKDNVYNIDVEVSDGVGGTTTNSFTITIVPLNDNLPIYTTGPDLNVDENVQVVTTIVATDIDLKVSATTPTPLFDNQVVTYSIVTVALGGAPDSDLFSINPNTGVLQFITAGADYDIVGDQGWQ